MKTIFSSVAVILGVHSFAQDSTTPSNILHKLKPGIFADYNEFLNNKPSITAQFEIKPVYVMRKFEDSVVDSVFRGYTYRFPDSTIKEIEAFGFFDGNQLYISTKRGIDFKRQGFYPVSYIGRFSFIEINSKTPLSVISIVFSFIGSVLDQIIPSKREMLFYFNKSGKFLEAKPETIGILLKKDKDLLKEYIAENKVNIETFKKYLVKMNERYPL